MYVVEVLPAEPIFIPPFPIFLLCIQSCIWGAMCRLWWSVFLLMAQSAAPSVIGASSVTHSLLSFKIVTVASTTYPPTLRDNQTFGEAVLWYRFLRYILL